MNTTPYYDYFTYKKWVYESYSKGFNNLYPDNPKTLDEDINQPPGSILILRGSYEVFLQTAKMLTRFMDLKEGATLWVNDQLLIFFLRLPSIIADLTLGLLIYFFVRSKTREKIALAASALYLLSPPVVYNSTVWGQMDSINNLFFFASVVFMVEKKTFPSVLFFALSLFTKLSLLPLIPLYLLLALSGRFFKLSTFAISLAAASTIIVILTLPFSTNPFWIIEFAIKASSGWNQGISASAFNLWWLIFDPILRITYPPSIHTIFLGVELGTWARIIFAFICLPIFFLSWRLLKDKKFKTDSVFLFFAIIAFATFLFLPKMHERYLYPVFPLLIAWVALKNRYWIVYVILSIIHFLNLYLIWNPSLFLFRQFEDAVKSQESIRFLCFSTIVIFGFFYLQIFPLINSHKAKPPGQQKKTKSPQ